MLYSFCILQNGKPHQIIINPKIWAHYKQRGLFNHSHDIWSALSSHLKNIFPGGHWEGRILMTIFFLLFWDIIYNSIQGLRGIFLSHYQVFPLDMFTDSFYRNRKTLIDEKLKEIKESTIEDLIEKMESVWNSRPESQY